MTTIIWTHVSEAFSLQHPPECPEISFEIQKTFRNWWDLLPSLQGEMGMPNIGPKQLHTQSCFDWYLIPFLRILWLLWVVLGVCVYSWTAWGRWSWKVLHKSPFAFFCFSEAFPDRKQLAPAKQDTLLSLVNHYLDCAVSVGWKQADTLYISTLTFEHSYGFFFFFFFLFL